MIITEKIYEQVKACEKATKNKRYAKGYSKRKSELQIPVNNINNMQSKEEVLNVIIFNKIIVI